MATVRPTMFNLPSSTLWQWTIAHWAVLWHQSTTSLAQDRMPKADTSTRVKIHPSPSPTIRLKPATLQCSTKLTTTVIATVASWWDPRTTLATSTRTTPQLWWTIRQLEWTKVSPLMTKAGLTPVKEEVRHQTHKTSTRAPKPKWESINSTARVHARITLMDKTTSMLDWWYSDIPNSKFQMIWSITYFYYYYFENTHFS